MYMNSQIAMVVLLLSQGLFFMNFVIANAFMQKQIYKALNSHATQTKAHICILFDGIFFSQSFICCALIHFAETELKVQSHSVK